MHENSSDVEGLVLSEPVIEKPKIGIFGFGSAGVDIVAHALRIPSFSNEVEITVVDTDGGALIDSQKEDKDKRATIAQIDSKGGGTGGNPEKGKQLLKNAEAWFAKKIEELDIVFIVTGVGGGTGGGGSPAFADIVNEKGIKSIALTLSPFGYEGRGVLAEKSLQELYSKVAGLTIVDSDRLYSILTPDGDENPSFEEMNQIVCNAIAERLHAMISLILEKGKRNSDLQDILERVIATKKPARENDSDEEEKELFFIGINNCAEETKDEKDRPSIKEQIKRVFSETFSRTDSLENVVSQVIINISDEGMLMGKDMLFEIKNALTELLGKQRDEKTSIKISTIKIPGIEGQHITILAKIRVKDPLIINSQTQIETIVTEEDEEEEEEIQLTGVETKRRSALLRRQTRQGQPAQAAATTEQRQATTQAINGKVAHIGQTTISRGTGTNGSGGSRLLPSIFGPK